MPVHGVSGGQEEGLFKTYHVKEAQCPCHRLCNVSHVSVNMPR